MQETIMPKAKLMWISISLIAAFAFGWLVNAKRDTENLAVPVVRTYDVPAERADEIRSNLNRLFRVNDSNSEGSAQIFGNGVMLVRAPIGFQRGIKNLVEKLANEKPVPHATVHLDYWLVTGQTDNVSNASSMPQLSKVLEAISQVDGPRKFRILEHLSSNSMTGLEVEVKGWLGKVKSVAVVKNDFIGLRLDLHSKLGEVRTDTLIKAGEFLVLGQNAVEPGLQVGNEKLGTGQANVYYIVRSEVVK